MTTPGNFTPPDMDGDGKITLIDHVLYERAGGKVTEPERYGPFAPAAPTGQPSPAAPAGPPASRAPVQKRTSSVFPPARSPQELWPTVDWTGRAPSAPVGSREWVAQAEQRGRVADRDEQQRPQREAQAERNRLTELYQRDLARSEREIVYVDGRRQKIHTYFDENGVRREVEVLGGYRTDDRPEPLDPAKLAQWETASAEERQKLSDLSPTARARYISDLDARRATYEVLNLPEVHSDARFIMNRGKRERVPGQAGLGGIFGRLAEQLTPKELRDQEVTNMMTVAGGVTWFRKLAHDDPVAYDELIDLLVGADYLADSRARKGGYTIAAGQAFAVAAADAAENFLGGGKDDLRTFLQKMQDSRKEAEKKAYTPIQRDYEDPEFLHATARSAAEELLGRGLTDAEAAKFASRFRGLEEARYDSIDAAGHAGGSATVVRPSAAGQAEAFARDPQFAADRSQQQVGRYMDSLMRLVRGGG